MIRTFRGTTNSWYLNLRAIRILSEAREGTSDRHDHSAINLNIIQNLAAAVEGSTRSLLINHIEYSKYYEQVKEQVNLDLKAIIDESLNSLYKKSWNDLIYFANQILGTKLKEYYTADFATIENLFQLRNITAHGGVIIKKIDMIPFNPELGFDSDEYQIDYDNKEGLTKYLLKENLISSSIPHQIEYWEYFNDNVTKYFREYSYKFMNDIYSTYLNKFEICKQIEKDRNIIKEYSDR